MTDAPKAPEATTAAPSRAAFAFIFVTVLLDMMALGIIIPVLPKLIKAFMNGDTASAAHVVGYFGSAWALMQFVFQPVLGALSDRFGRRPVIILSNLGLGLDYILMALSPNLWFLFVGRLISGVTAASFSTAGAYIADVTAPEKRAARFGLLGAAFGLGFVIGPAVGGVLGDIDLKMPFWGAAVLSLVNATYGFFVLPESLARARRAPFSLRRANPIGVDQVRWAPMPRWRGWRWPAFCSASPTARCPACSYSMPIIAMAGTPRPSALCWPGSAWRR